jgi:hypothetical protein
MDNVSLDDRLAQMSREVREELAQGKDLAGSFFCRMGKLMVEQLLKAEVADTLGRDKGERRESGQAGYRNGYKGRTLRTGEGPIELDVPQVRGLPRGRTARRSGRDSGGDDRCPSRSWRPRCTPAASRPGTSRTS